MRSLWRQWLAFCERHSVSVVTLGVAKFIDFLQRVYAGEFRAKAIGVAISVYTRGRQCHWLP
eukprot:SAG31_NODE_1450_length_8307_cov_3.676657_10_plen_62_part_00